MFGGYVRMVMSGKQLLKLEQKVMAVLAVLAKEALKEKLI